MRRVVGGVDIAEVNFANTISTASSSPVAKRAIRGATSSAACAAVGLSPMSMRCEAMVRCENLDRKSTRLNSSHSQISYAVFCLKKKKKKKHNSQRHNTQLADSR